MFVSAPSALCPGSLDGSLAAQACLALFDALGREAAVFFDGPLEAGLHRLGFDASALAPGVYLLRTVVTDAHGVRTLASRVTVAR